VCVPPQFNSEAETREDCMTCFCFEHTSDCYSSDLFISEANALLVKLELGSRKIALVLLLMIYGRLSCFVSF